jgi:hypothetical protein
VANSYADQAKAGEMHGWHVYVLSEDGDEYCKIGSALTVKYRVEGLRNGNPRDLKVVVDWHFASRHDSRSVETRALILCADRRLPGRDWLRMPASSAVGMVVNAIAELGIQPKSVKT